MNIGYEGTSQITGDGKESVAAGFGCSNKAKASIGNWIVLVHRNSEHEITHIKSAKAGTDVKPDVWYLLNENGEFIEV